MVYSQIGLMIDKEPKEQEANCFAANLLVPKKMLKKIMKDYDLSNFDVSALSNFFGAPEDVIRYQLNKME